MYKGNMRDFVEKLDKYLWDKYEGRIYFSKITINGVTDMLISFFPKGTISTRAYRVYDREDFEDQVYDYVNEKLKEYVSW